MHRHLHEGNAGKISARIDDSLGHRFDEIYGLSGEDGVGSLSNHRVIDRVREAVSATRAIDTKDQVDAEILTCDALGLEYSVIPATANAEDLDAIDTRHRFTYRFLILEPECPSHQDSIHGGTDIMNTQPPYSPERQQCTQGRRSGIPFIHLSRGTVLAGQQ